MKSRAWLLLAVLAPGLAGCAAVARVGVHFLYRKAELPAAQVVRDVCYMPGPNCDSNAHRLDLYLPAGRDWPLVVFIYGGGWDRGDKNLRVGGADVYANIGRYFASQGIGAVVINYRLQPTTDWRGQVADARQAARWVHEHAASYGGRPDDIFLMGHSAGGWLATFTGLEAAGPDSSGIRGVICVSGAALDLTDRETYALGENPRRSERRFRNGDPTDGWKHDASPVSYVHAGAPPFLILYAAGEQRQLQRQARCLAQALDRAGVENTVVRVPGESHPRMVLTLSRPDKTSVPAILAFMRKHGS
ncbi:MAG TPA: alpha/beta hydrolase [Candidatus Eisenbacteria bacterium]|jgi:acetyl esterase/lipase